ncbi:MAG: hypothetical protein KDK97_05250 [Verrucomicrobiales bacterium]|nr:hypothetical protein [Verrucomicrobiales bacterium]
MNSSTRFAMRTLTFLALLLTLLPTAQADITSGLVGWWKMTEGSGTTVPDSSGNNNTGAITGATWGESQGMKCLIQWSQQRDHSQFSQPEFSEHKCLGLG